MPHDPDAQKQRLAGWLLTGNVALTVAKSLVAVITGSVSLLSEAVHSASDVIASLFAYLGIRAAAVPPDEDHPYGHGKIESLAGFGESVMVFGIVIYVAFESVHRLFAPPEIDEIWVGLIAIAASTLLAAAVGWHVERVARATGSLALKANALHWRMDAVTSLAVFAGLLIYWRTGWRYADPILGILLSIWMAWGAYRLSQEAFRELIDTMLPESENRRVREMVEETEGVLSYHRLRTRRSGNIRHIDMHIVVPNELSVVEAHDLADALEKRIGQEFSPAHVVIHVDPFSAAKARTA